MASMSFLLKPASGKCNMRCDYCFYRDEMYKRTLHSYGMMSDATLKNVIRKAIYHASGQCNFMFQGGEPTLCGLPFYERALEYAEYFNRRRGLEIHFSLQTNGYEITEEWCRFFSENHFLIGLSLDGTKEIHDKYRHGIETKETYKRIIQTANLFDTYGVEYNILTVVHKDVAEQIDKIYESYKRLGFRWQQYIACLDPLGEEQGGKAYSLSPGAYGQFLIRLFDLWYADWKRGEQPYIRQFENYLWMLSGYLPESCEQRGACGIMYVLEADGSVYPCDFFVLDEYCLGNINVYSIAEIDEARAKLQYIERSENQPHNCKECKYYSLCRGGCYRSRIGDAKSGIGKNYFCEGYYNFFETHYEKLVGIAERIQRRRY